MRGLLGMFIALASFTTNAQLTETMGTAGSNGSTIATQESLGNFSLTALTYSGTGTIRNNLFSNGYAGASGSINIQLLATQTFQVQSINAASCTVSDSISFGVGKSTNAANGSELKLEYSIDNGSSWIDIPFAALPTGTGTTFNVSPAKWYKRTVAMPAGAINSALWLRFKSYVPSGAANPVYRIDDLTMTCGSTVSCGTPTAAVAVTGNTVFCEGTGATADLDVTTSLTSPLYQWYNQDGQLFGETTSSLTVNFSGTYYAVVSNANGCEATTAGVYVLAYPAPQFCIDTVEACAGSNVTVCARLNSGDLIISEYVEGSNFNKYLELFNGTCGDVDLSVYEVRAYHNGLPITSVPTFTIPLSGVLPEGDVYVIAHRDATAWTGTPDLLTDSLQYNGDDAFYLINTLTDEIIDIFGSVGFDPGSSWRDTVSASPTLGWTTENKTLIRKACVYTGIRTNPALPGIYGFPTLFTEWDTLGVNNVSNLGMHAFGATNYDFTITGGGSAIISEADNCATIRVGEGTGVITASADFCGFNDCMKNAVIGVVTDDCPESRSAGKKQQMNGEANAYPNPFTENTMISFKNETAGNVTITLTDMQGKSVAVTTDAYMEKGTHRLELNASGLNNGTYLVRVQTVNGTELFRIVKMTK